MIRIGPGLQLDESELDFEFVRSSGPGGQNVNKVATAVQLRFDAAGSPSLTEPVRKRLLKAAGSKATKDGHILIVAQRHRTQERNRSDAVKRLVQLIRDAATPPKQRKKTRPTKASKRRRLETKKQRGQVKKLRKPPRPE